MKRILLFLFFFPLSFQYYNKAIQLIDPVDCVTPQRFDVLAKYIYAKHYKLKVNSLWHFNLYKRHLELWNNLKETDGVTLYKDGIDQFITSYHSVLNSVSINFNPRLSTVPLYLPTYNLLDGAHRVGACLSYNKYLFSDTEYPKPGFNITSEYFKSIGLEQKYLDAMALEYALLKPNIYFVNIFPAAKVKNYEEIEKILNKYGAIVYKKDVFLKNYGPFHFIKLLYEGQEWIGLDEDGFQEAQEKAFQCFPKDCVQFPLRVYLFETSELKKTILVKNEIRKLCKIGHSAVHINDTHKESRMEARVVFNENSIHCLNNKPRKDFPHFLKFILSYKRWLKVNGLNSEEFCIDGSSIFAAYGIREAGDLDFLYHGDPLKLPKTPCDCDEHSSELKYHVTTKDDIIFNPENHFYYKDVKFASLEVIKKMKQKRAEKPKDFKDLSLVKAHLEKYKKDLMKA